MVYCTWEDVQRNLQYISLKPDSKPTLDDVIIFCNQLSVELESHLAAAGISLPVTDTEKLELLKKITVDGVTARVFRSFNTEEALKTAEAYQAEYDKAISHIEDTPAIIDAVEALSSPGYHQVERTGKYRREDRDW